MHLRPLLTEAEVDVAPAETVAQAAPVVIAALVGRVEIVAAALVAAAHGQVARVVAALIPVKGMLRQALSCLKRPFSSIAAPKW